MEAVVAWCEGVKACTGKLDALQIGEGQSQAIGSQAGEIVDENLTVLMDSFFAIVETNKLQKIYI